MPSISQVGETMWHLNLCVIFILLKVIHSRYIYFLIPLSLVAHFLKPFMYWNTYRTLSRFSYYELCCYIYSRQESFYCDAFGEDNSGENMQKKILFFFFWVIFMLNSVLVLLDYVHSSNTERLFYPCSITRIYYLAS